MSTNSSSQPERFNIGGLLCHVWGRQAALESPLPVGVLIITHGRGGDQASIFPICERAISIAQSHSDPDSSESAPTKSPPQPRAARSLVIISLTQRNHGERLVDPLANEGFKTNPNHAIDMYAVQRGTAKDMSYLVDYSEAYLFPMGERKVEGWFCAGVSLGGE